MHRTVPIVVAGVRHVARWDLGARWRLQNPEGQEPRKLLDLMLLAQQGDPQTIAAWFQAVLDSGRIFEKSARDPYTLEESLAVADSFPLDALGDVINRVFEVGNTGVDKKADEVATSAEGKAPTT